MAKNYDMGPGTGDLKLTGQRTRLIYTVRTRVLERNWPLIIAYIVITVVGIIASYFTSGWLSVGLALSVAVVTFFIGLHMLRDAITITNEVQ
jgi:hypothetical protein